MAQLQLGNAAWAKRLGLPLVIAVAAASAGGAWMLRKTPPTGSPRLAAVALGGIVVATRSYDLGRTGWNRNEAVLSPATVGPQTFHKLGELRVDGKIEASPLYVAGATTPAGPRDLLLVAASNNLVYAFDAGTKDKLWSRSLGTPPDELASKGPPAIYSWGITATPVVDSETEVLYVVRAAVERDNQGKDNQVYRLYGLRLADGTDAIDSQAVDGFSVQRNDTKFFDNGKQLIRTALALWRNSTGDKAVIRGCGGRGPR